MGVSGAPPSTASEGGAGQIDTQSVERYYINITVAGSRCNKYPGQYKIKMRSNSNYSPRGALTMSVAAGVKVPWRGRVASHLG
jgi:hypothetical protein